MVKNLLEKEGHRVEVTGLIKSAIDVLRSNRFDLILMDLNLPDFRGEQAIRLLRRNLQLDTPIVVLSGEIKWRSGSTPTIADRPVRLRFHLQKASLYSFWLS